MMRALDKNGNILPLSQLLTSDTQEKRATGFFLTKGFSKDTKALCTFRKEMAQELRIIYPAINKSNPIAKSDFVYVIKGVDGSIPAYEGQFGDLDLQDMYVWLQGSDNTLAEAPSTSSADSMETTQEGNASTTSFIVVENQEEEGEVVELEEGEAFDPGYIYREKKTQSPSLVNLKPLQKLKTSTQWIAQNPQKRIVSSYAHLFIIAKA